MFSGIIEQKGKLVRKERSGKQTVLTFETKAWTKPLKRGESVSVNGVCLTVVSLTRKGYFTVEAVPETLTQTTLSSLKLNESVNLERSLTWGERVSGHFVLGHVDGVGRIIRKKIHGGSFVLEIEVPNLVLQNLVPKGSIAVDGVSLTLQKISGRFISIAIVPHTAKITILGRKKKGDLVNLEADVIAKHLAQWVNSNQGDKQKAHD